jgi:hypothetical protein
MAFTRPAGQLLGGSEQSGPLSAKAALSGQFFIFSF